MRAEKSTDGSTSFERLRHGIPEIEWARYFDDSAIG